MRSALAAAAQRRAVGRTRSSSLSAIPPPEGSEEYLPELALIAASILYRSPLLSQAGRPVYILNAAAFPDALEVDYNSLLSYVLARLPGEDELISGTEYEIVFFAGGQPDNATTEKKQGPSTGWYLQAYHVLSRATRKKLQMLYIVHPRTWVRVLISIFGTIVSPKFRRKIVHVNSMSGLALYIPIEQLLIPPSAYIQDRKVAPDIYAPYMTGRRAFGVKHPLPKNITTGETRLPRVLRETTAFVLMSQNVRVEGLFRIPPSSLLAGVLKEAYDRGQKFIVWREGEALLAPPGLDKSAVDEIRVEDTYGVHLAASLIKNWYRDLKEPIFPESSYAHLQARYADQDTITLEDLVDIILPASQTSPITRTARDILIRHLLPLLSSVASHADENKMNPENLSIVFSMCLVRGSDQLEDSRVSATIRKVLIEAIKAWPQLQAGLDIDSRAFEADLRPPGDSRDYEDPLEDDMHHQGSEDETTENRITMNDSSNANAHAPSPSRVPTLPPRRSRAASLKAALSAPHHVMDALPSLPKRKPAVPAYDPVTTAEGSNAEDPPRYSTVFDADGRSIHGSPTTVGPADGFAPPRRADFSYDEVKEGSETPFTDTKTEVSKYKAISSPIERQGGFEHTHSNTEAQSSQPSGLVAAGHSSGQSAESSPSTPKPTASSIHSASTQMHAELSNGFSATNAAIHRKPCVKPTSSPGPRQPAGIHSLARPVVPVQHARTIPIVRHNGIPGLSAPPVPKPRTPSPGLLKRMTSIENVRGQQDGLVGPSRLTLEPKKMNQRKTSVDDLRRLYEDRVDTAKNLVAATNTVNRNVSDQV